MMITYEQALKHTDAIKNDSILKALYLTLCTMRIPGISYDDGAAHITTIDAAIHQRELEVVNRDE